MKKPKPRHIKKEIAKQVRAIQIQMGLTPRQMRAMTALTDMNHCLTAGRLSMAFPHLGSGLPVSQARQEMFAAHDAQNRALLSSPRLKPVRNLGEVEGSGILPPEMDPEVLRDILDASVPANLANVIDRTTHLVTPRSNPLRELWEKHGDQSDLRPIPGNVNVDALLDRSANPELRQHIAGLLSEQPLGLTDPGRAKDRDFTKLAVKATPEQIAEMGKDMKLIFKDGVQVAGTGWSVDHDGDIEHIPSKED